MANDVEGVEKSNWRESVMHFNGADLQLVLGQAGNHFHIKPA